MLSELHIQLATSQVSGHYVIPPNEMTDELGWPEEEPVAQRLGQPPPPPPVQIFLFQDAEGRWHAGEQGMVFRGRVSCYEATIP